MADKTDGLQRIVDNANRRSRSRASSYFDPPDAIIKFGAKVLAWMQSNDVPVSTERFRHEFICQGQSRLGFEGYVRKIVTKIHTVEEFHVLLTEHLGVNLFWVEEFDEELRVLVCGSREWSEHAHRSYIHRHLKQLPSGSVVIEGAEEGVDEVAGQVALDLGLEVEEYVADREEHGSKARAIRNRDMVNDGEPDFVLVFHDDVKSDKNCINIAKRAKKAGLKVKLLDGERFVNLDFDKLIGVEDEQA